MTIDETIRNEEFSPSQKAMAKLLRRLDVENKYFIVRFAREEFEDEFTRKKFISDYLFREQYLDLTFFDTAGDEVYIACLNFFEDYISARQWYFGKLPVLDYKRPYDYCKKGDKKEIVDLLGRIEHGIY